MELEVKINERQLQRMVSSIRSAPAKVRQKIKRKWGVVATDFRTHMQNKHLSGGTTDDRLARISSNLYNALSTEVKITTDEINVSVYFTDNVGDYAPTHEYGDPNRNIKPRMNLRNEWNNWKIKFFTAAEIAIEEGLKDA